MDYKACGGVLQNISQRAAYSYLISLSDFTCVLPEGSDPARRGEVEAAQRDLHAFYRTFYEHLFNHPEQFGLPLAEDDAMTGEEPNAKERKQEVTRKLKKPKEAIEKALAFLMAAALNGRVEGGLLRLGPEEAAALKKSKPLRAFLQGMQPAGLALVEGEPPALACERFAAMLPAWQSLAAACAQHPSPELGRFHFARCDFRALRKDHRPEALELYRVFGAEDYARLAELHAYYTRNGYKPEVHVHDVAAWLVQYQGNKKIKSTPLFQIEYQDRYRSLLAMQIKCASTNRIAALIGQQPLALQEDFKRRTFACRGKACDWCRNQKTLGPSVIEIGGEQRTVCWYTLPEVRGLDDATVDLMKQYLVMHEALLPAS